MPTSLTLWCLLNSHHLPHRFLMNLASFIDMTMTKNTLCVLLGCCCCCCCCCWKWGTAWKPPLDLNGLCVLGTEQKTFARTECPVTLCGFLCRINKSGMSHCWSGHLSLLTSQGVQVSSAWSCIRKINFLPQLKWQHFRPLPSLCPYWSPKQLYSHPGCSVDAAIHGNWRQSQHLLLPADKPCGTSITRVRPHLSVCPAGKCVSLKMSESLDL